jgi:hypothetical protein
MPHRDSSPTDADIFQACGEAAHEIARSLHVESRQTRRAVAFEKIAMRVELAKQRLKAKRADS